MTIAEYQDALRLLESATTLLQRRKTTSPAKMQRELQRLTLELALLRARVGQVPPAKRRN